MNTSFLKLEIQHQLKRILNNAFNNALNSYFHLQTRLNILSKERCDEIQILQL